MAKYKNVNQTHICKFLCTVGNFKYSIISPFFLSLKNSHKTASNERLSMQAHSQDPSEITEKQMG